jgi:hypothetical protein
MPAQQSDQADPKTRRSERRDADDVEQIPRLGDDTLKFILSAIERGVVEFLADRGPDEEDVAPAMIDISSANRPRTWAGDAAATRSSGGGLLEILLVMKVGSHRRLTAICRTTRRLDMSVLTTCVHRRPSGC